MKKIISIILVAVMLVSMTQLTTMADILPTVETGTDEQQTASVQTVNASMLGDTKSSDNVEVSSLSVTASTGTAPFDTVEKPGNDTSATDTTIRTFDTIVYNFTVTTTASQTADARVKLEFVLPLTNKQAEFDTSAMLWMDTTSGYMWEITTADTTGYQTLTCYKYLSSSDKPNDSQGAFTFTENVNVKVLNMGNNSKIKPTFKATMVGGTATPTVSPNEITVSAAPKYNIQIAGNPVYKRTFDFNSGNEKAKAYGEGYGKGEVVGRAVMMGITLQLYNDNPDKGFKGIEVPTGNITFDIKLESTYAGVDVTDEYKPLLWSCDGNLRTPYGSCNSDGRVLYGSTGSAQGQAPTNTGNGYNCCYNGGSWSATQSGTTISVTVSGYEINVDKMPTKNLDTTSGKYGEEFGIGCFSAGEMWIVQPFNKIGETSSNSGPKFDIVTQYGESNFMTVFQAMNMKATTVSGTVFRDTEGTSDAQTIKTDDRMVRSLNLTLPGALQNRVNYANETNWKTLGVGVANKYDGNDFGTPGTELRITGGFSYRANDEEDNQLYWGTNLSKFYGSAFEVTDNVEWDLRAGATIEETFCYYATKKDGTDWKNDSELQNTYEDDLVFYNSLSDIPSGHFCVGILFCFKGPGPVIASDPYYYGSVSAKIRDDITLAGKTYMLASTSRIWTKSMFESVGKTLDTISDWSQSSTKLSSFPEGFYKSGNIDGSTFYTKETYAADGSGAKGTHNSEWLFWGDTLLVVGYETGITKSLAQTVEGKAKDTYYLDSNQRVVDFKLQPSMSNYKNYEQTSQKATVKIVDTLPKHLKYISNSCYFGGTYQQGSENGGTQGTITGDTTQREPDSIIYNDSDGTQTLTWEIEVTVGQTIPAIYYSAMIGNQEDSTLDVPSADTTPLETNVRITSATYDLRTPTAENGNYDVVGLSAVKGSVSSYGKYAHESQVDVDGNIDYTIYYNPQNGEVKNAVLLDTMPQNGLPDDTDANDFTGGYEVAEWKLDKTKYSTPSNLTLYYTTDSSYAGRTMQGNNAITVDTIQNWTQATIEDNGTATFARTPVAWAVIGDIPQGQSINISLTIKLQPDYSTTFKEISKYTNYLSNSSFTIPAQTTAVKRGFTFTKNVYDSNNKSLNGTDTTTYKFKLSKLGTDGTDISLSNNERTYLKEGVTTAQINSDGTFSLKGGESIRFVGLTNGEQYKIQETGVPNYVLKTECSDSGFDSDTKTLTFTSNNNTEMSTEFKNILQTIDITLKYYDRSVESGKPSDISSQSTTFTKTYMGAELYNGSTFNVSQLIVDTAVYADGKVGGIDNIVDTYSIWGTQAEASTGICAMTNHHTNQNYTATDYHTDCYGYTYGDENYSADKDNPEKWITYFNADGQEVDYEKCENVTTKDVYSVNVWLFNEPRDYTVTAHQADDKNIPTAITGSDLYVGNNVTNIYNVYYNQRLGEAIDDSYIDDSTYLTKYGIKGYAGDRLSTSSKIEDDSDAYYFQYWSFDDKGKTVASTDIKYNYRITKDIELYAIYAKSEYSVGAPGLTVSQNNPDVFIDENGVSKTRLNTMMNPYNCPDYDDTITQTSIVYVMQNDDEDLTKMTAEQLKILRDGIKSILEKGKSGTVTVIEATKTASGFKYDVQPANGTTENVIKLTNKNRLQFSTTFTTSALNGKRLLAFAAMYREDNWIVSDNYIDYNYFNS